MAAIELRESTPHESLLQAASGLLLSAALAAVAIRLGAVGWLQAHGMSALTVAIVLGIVLGNTVYPGIAATSGAGVAFSKQTLLRAGVILYGMRLTLHDIGQVGTTGVLIDALLLGSTFALAYFLGTRVFGLDRSTSLLIGAGNAICGAAAVMATEPLVRAKAEQVTVFNLRMSHFNNRSIETPRRKDNSPADSPPPSDPATRTAGGVAQHYERSRDVSDRNLPS